jgi:hypothetical protein
MTDFSDQKTLTSLFVHALMYIIPEDHALVVEFQGEKYDLTRKGDNFEIWPCDYDTAPGSIVTTVEVAPEEKGMFDQLNDMINRMKP